MFQEKKLDTEKIVYNIIRAKDGLEIGGGSNYDVIYKNVNKLDNIDFIKKEDKLFNNGDNYKCDATDMKSLPSNKYDFVFASNILQYIANPLKALYEWKRVLKQGGFIILKFDITNDKISSFSKIEDNFNNEVKEDDLSSLPIIMNENKNINEKFIRDSLSNYHSRKLKHFNYDIDLLNDITDYLNLKTFYFNETDDNLLYIIN